MGGSADTKFSSTIEAYERGETPREIGEREGVTAAAIRRRLRLAGVEMRGTARLTPEQDAEAEAMYRDGTGVPTIGRHFGVGVTAVRRALQRRGLRTRNRQEAGALARALSDAERAAAGEMYVATGGATARVADAFDVDPKTITTIVRELGIQRPKRRVDQAGYVVVRCPPEFAAMAKANGSTRRDDVMEHRLVMAAHLGRALLPTETVHHVNGVRHDNRIENLQLHQRAHPQGVRMVCLCCGSDRVAPAEIAER